MIHLEEILAGLAPAIAPDRHGPVVDVFRYDSITGPCVMEFRLVYQGPLPSAGTGQSRTPEKHAIRKALHPQLAALWRTHPVFQHMDPERPSVLARRYAMGPFQFLPFVRDHLGVACSLDILFLRRDQPGGLIQHGGDIDNRIKVLFDALRMPQNLSQTPKDAVPAVDETPFYCLLEDDRLIAEVKITTDRLLQPTSTTVSRPDSEVMLVINVRTHSHDNDMWTSWAAEAP